MIFSTPVAPGVTLLGKAGFGSGLQPRLPSLPALGSFGAATNCQTNSWARGTGTASNYSCRLNSCAKGQTIQGTDGNGIAVPVGRECVPYKAPGILSLQQALMTLATASGRPGIAPQGGADGVYGPGTRNAVLQALPLIGGLFNSDVALAFDGIAVAAIASPSTADSIIQQYSDSLTPIILLAAQQTSPAIAPGILPAGLPSTTTPWYTQTWGKAAIGVGAIAVLLMLFSGPSQPRYYAPAPPAP